MTSITGVSGGAPAPSWFRWQPEWNGQIARAIVIGLIAGGSASLGFWSTWQTLQADVRQTKADVTALRAADAELASDLAKMDARQDADDNLHSGQAVADTAIQKSLDQLREDLRDFRRDLTGRVR